MSRTTVVIILAFTSCKLFARHCPRGCSGMIMLKTPVSSKTVYGLAPVLVDENKQVIINTMYVGRTDFDNCAFLFYPDFQKRRAKKIMIHPWYRFHTSYHFAAGCYMVRYNFCKCQDRKTFIGYADPYSLTKGYRYIEIPASDRIHLHNYSNQLFRDRTEEIRNDVRASVLELARKNWTLRNEDCRD